MGVPLPEQQPAAETTAEALFSVFTNIAAAERRRHATVLNYWLSIRGDRDFPAIQDLDPLELSDAGACSVLLELIGAGEDAEIRHVGQALAPRTSVERIRQVERPSLLACIADRLPEVAVSRRPVAFEEDVSTEDGATRASITLLPFTSTGTWVDYVYGFVSPERVPEAGEAPEPSPGDEPENVVGFASASETEDAAEDAQASYSEEPAAEAEPAPPPAPASSGRAGFSARFFESLASVEGFFGTVAKFEADTSEEEVAEQADAPPADPTAERDSESAEVAEEPETGEELEVAAEPEAQGEPEAELEPEPEPEPVTEPEPEPEPEAVSEAEPVSETEATPEEAAGEHVPGDQATEGSLQSRLTEVRSKADEARAAKLRADAALVEGLSAAYDFALDAEDQPEEYLRLLEARGLKIQLRSPMTPVVRLAFDESCDESTIGDLEKVLNWALRSNLPRGSLVERIEAEGGIAAVLNGRTQK